MLEKQAVINDPILLSSIKVVFLIDFYIYFFVIDHTMS